MPELDAVTQRFIADTSQYVAAVKAAADAARDFANTNGMLLAALKGAQEEMGGTTETALALTGAEDNLTSAMMDKTAAAILQGERLNDLRNNMGYMYIATRALAAGEADLARVLALTVGITEIAIRVNGELAMQSALAAQAISAQQLALTGVGTDLVLAGQAAGKFGQAEYDLITVMTEKTGAAARQGSQLHDLSADMAGTAAASTALAGSEQRLALAAASAAASQAASYTLLGAAAQNAADKTKTGATMAIGWWRLSANTIHWIISGLAEYLAVALPGTIALAAGAFVMYQGVVEDVGRRLQALYTTTEATNALFGKTTGDVLGMGHAFQTAQNAANPVAYQLLGEYLNAARANAVNFAAAGLQVARVIGELGARIAVDLNTHAAEFQGLIANMVPDLVEFGQILGNIGHALLNFASDMPGLAEVLLKIADAISRVVLWISSLNHYLILGVMAFEEFNRWGGLLVTIFGKMGLASTELAVGIFSPIRAIGILRGLLGVIPALVGRLGTAMAAAGAEMGFFGADAYAAGTAMEAFGAESKLAIAGLAGWQVILIAVAAVGLGILIDKLVTARTSVQRFGDSLEQNVAKASNLQAFSVLAQSMGQMNAQEQKVSASVNDAARALERQNQAAGQAVSANTQFSAIQQQLMSNTSNLVGGADKISRAYGMTFSQSLALADMAGVKLSTTEITLGKNANIAGMQIQSMVDGYARMNQVGGALGTDMNALAIQSGLAGTKVASLNQALDQFVSNGTSLTSTLASLNQDLTQVGNTGVQVGQRFREFSGTAKLSIDKVAESMKSFSGTGAQTWQNYDAALQQAQQFTDALRVASAYGAVTQRNFTGSIADTVKALLPFTSHSATAVSELSMLAQEAGGPATSNYKKLKQWVDQNDESAKKFNKSIQEETAQLSNAGAAAAEFASTLQSQMQQELAQALLATNNINGAVAQFQSAVMKSGGQISASSPQYHKLYDLLTAAGLSAQQAKNELKLLQNTINAMHGKNINIDVNTAYTQSGNRPPGQSLPGGYPGGTGGQHGMTVGFGGGGIVGGPGGVDVIHAMLTAGEAVLTARAVAALGGPLAVHSLNTQPSQGVLTAGGGGGATTALGLNLMVENKMDGQTVNTAQRRATLVYTRRNPRNNLTLRAR